MPPRTLTNLELQKYSQNEPKFNGVCSSNNLPTIKDGAYLINLDEYESIETHWIVDNFGGEHIPKEIKKSIRNKNITIFIEYKHTIQLCVDTFVLDLLISCEEVKVWLYKIIFS